jgi:hypothetical protein
MVEQRSRSVVAVYQGRGVPDGLSDVFEPPRGCAFEHCAIVGIARSEDAAPDFNRRIRAEPAPRH